MRVSLGSYNEVYVNVSVPIRIANQGERPQTLVLEPWAHELDLAPGCTYTIVSEGDTSQPMEIAIAESTITVYCFDTAGATMSVFAEDGSKLF